MNKTIILALLALTTLYAACTKESTPAPKAEEPLGEFSNELIIGKWEAVRVASYHYRGDTLIGKSTWAKDTGLIGGPRNQILDYWSQDKISMITFCANNTFYHEDVYGDSGSYMLNGIFPANGKWHLDKDSFTLTTEYTIGLRDVGWGSVYTRDNTGHYVVGLSKVEPDTSLGPNDFYQTVVVIQKQ